MNSLSKSVNKLSSTKKNSIYILSRDKKNGSKSRKKLKDIIKRNAYPDLDSSKKDVHFDKKIGRLQTTANESLSYKKNNRYFDKRKHSMKKRILKTSLQLPNTRSNKSMNIRSELGSKSVQIKETLNARTMKNQSSMSLNQRFKSQVFGRKQTRNDPYNQDLQESSKSISFSPLIKGVKNVYKNDAFVNSYSHYRDRRNTSSLSSFTNSQNLIASIELQKYRKASEEKHKKNSTEKCAINSLIKNTQKQLKCLSYKLSTVISDGNYHNLLEEGQTNRVEVIEDTLIYCKVGLKYKFSPLTIRLKYNSKENLKVFYSSVSQMPNMKDNEYQYFKPRKICIWAEGRSKEFEKEYAYFTLSCPNQISVDILVRFNTMEKALGRKKIEKMEEYNLEEDLNKEIEALNNQEVSPNHLPIIHKEEVSDDIIKKNMKIAKKWKQIHEEKLEINKNLRPKKMEEARTMHKKLFLQNLKQKKHFLKRWDIVRELREKARIQDERIQNLKIFNGFWARLFQMREFLLKVHKKFDDRKQEILMDRRMLYCSNRIKRNFKVKIKQFAPTLDQRHNNLARYALDSVIQYIQEPSELRSKDILQNFLQNSADNYNTFMSFLSFARSADCINQFYKRRLKIKAIHVYVMEKMWDKSFINLTQSPLLSKTKSKKRVKEMKKICKITSEMKHQALKCIYGHRVLEYKIRFVLYRRRLAEEKEDENLTEPTGFSLDSSLKNYQARYKDINSLLYGDTFKRAVAERKDTNVSCDTNNKGKRNSNADVASIKRLKTKHKLEFNAYGLPVLNFNITQEEMEAIIRRIADMTSKKLLKLEKLASLSNDKINSDL
ncbi:unnamed protein product [Moneuplotes crassus]|uniref:Uncharacterized protein n=1 Tax=Euplotes crassus TaxID=5936 RepID=A0AAD1Y790_EUPCR|nr:unnamed protein product [Moneuplotes crassus]